MKYEMDIESRIRNIGSKRVVWKNNKVLELNDTAYDVLMKINQDKDKDTIIIELSNEYKVSIERLKNDVEKFLKIMLDRGVINEK